MLKFIKDTFSSLTISFLIKNYFFGIIIYAIFMYPIFDKSINETIAYDSVIFFTINLILYPFATLIWEELRNMFLGNTMFITQIHVLFIVKIVIKFMVFLMSIIIGPLGILYLWYVRNKYIKSNV
ncbi:MAG: hypothetical protein SPF17_07955 [Candidatus Mucispirillum faecigallinarum]|nr:hypothetical protein [Candidatus Mucispirillum faecigallinarum]